jgi:multidrug efflux pump subunit AcrA (membrane-fusion protein)
VTDGDKVSLRQVRLGRPYGELIEILAGLSEDESVAIDPVRAGIWLKEQAQ